MDQCGGFGLARKLSSFYFIFFNEIDNQKFKLFCEII